MIIYKSKYKQLSFDAEQQEVLYVMKPTTESLDDRTHRKEVVRATQAMQKYKVKFVICDFTSFFFINTPDTQQWMIEDIAPTWVGIGVVKLAIIMPKEFFAKLGIKQLTDDAEQQTNLPYQQNFFENYAAARTWFAEASL